MVSVITTIRRTAVLVQGNGVDLTVKNTTSVLILLVITMGHAKMEKIRFFVPVYQGI